MTFTHKSSQSRAVEAIIHIRASCGNGGASPMTRRGRRNSSSRHFASATASLSEGGHEQADKLATRHPPPPKPKVG